MPAIPSLRDAADRRVIDSRQLLSHLQSAAQSTHDLLRRSIARLQPRQSVAGAIPTNYQGLNSGPAPGAVAGIVLGSVAGFLLLLWLFYALSQGGGFFRANQDTEEEVVVRRSRSPPRRRRSRARTEMTSHSPRRERVIRQERVVRDFPPPREPSRVRETIVVEESRPERRVEGDDIVEVIEEHSSVAPPRRKSRRNSGGYRSVDPVPLPPGGFRTVDPNAIAGIVGGYSSRRPVR